MELPIVFLRLTLIKIIRQLVALVLEKHVAWIEMNAEGVCLSFGQDGKSVI